MPTDLPLQWGDYAHIQAKLNRLNRVDCYAWGLEAAMDKAIDAAQKLQLETPQAIQQTAETAARKERQRSSLRRIHQMEIVTPSASLIRQLEARDALRALQLRLSRLDWALLYSVAQGHSAAEVSSKLELTPANVRVRASRLRSQLRNAPWAA